MSKIRITPLPPAGYLRSCIDYCEKTGVIHWKYRPRGHFPSKREWLRWNARYAGTVAGVIDPRGYRRIRINRHRYKAHRLIWCWMTSEDPPYTIDHIQGGPDNNVWNNLRVATQKQQTHNVCLRKDNPTGYRGVTRRRKKWAAQITINGTRQWLGCFNSIEEAAAVYESEARKYHGEFFRG